ncbi:MAG TPA: bifunctional serine/threonine-protein kinase/formylglycine-generating enzyme family protein [Candidatus Sulfomarinibacteraceae bacterium]|nr:bifunctional serine/threonine-protein kinase/formylglycine-generating enzyme family protein [Candidatus Sulfomarinibacteraceae bacterium]
MPLLPAERLNKRYQIVSLLGQGHYGAVYRAWDVRDEVHVALKEYLDASVELQKRFREEARRLSDLRHPQLPAVRDHFAVSGVGQYLVSDYVDGVDLRALVQQYGPLPSPLIIEWLQAVCEPLAYMHNKGIAHLDVKPANIRITPAGEVFLVDSGLQGLGVAPGTRGYASPEQQKQSDDVGPVSDIYSLGATLYTLLTEKTPPGALQRESGLEVMPSAREVNGDVEPYLSIVASRAMSLRPDARYETVADFGRALERPAGRSVAQPEGARRTDAVPATPPPRHVPETRRKQIEQRTIWGLVGLLVLIVAAGVGISLFSATPLLGGSEEAATATTESQVIAALTAVAPTQTPTPDPTSMPTATPEPFTTKTGSRMIFMPGGLFRLGNDEGESDEGPSRMVRLDPYYIDETEVTNGAYAQCVAAGECESPAYTRASFYPDYYGNPEYDDYPVIYVNWEKARQFCEWREARLPSEAEWERAAGFNPEQGVKYTYPWGDEFDGALLNYCDANCYKQEKDSGYDDGYGDTAPVGSYPEGRSPTGVYDMLGNVMEWTNDWYERNYYTSAPEVNPLGPLDGFSKSVRGGSWLSERDELTVTRRTFYQPNDHRANLGFRCAQSAR